MKRFGTALAVVFVAIFVVAGCNDYGNTFQANTGAALTFISPSQIPACVPSATNACPQFTTTSGGPPYFTLTMNGSGFVAQTKVQWNRKTCPTNGTNGQPPGGALCGTTVTLDANGNVLTVTASVLASLVAKPGLATVNTINPASGTGQNGLSNPINFIIGNPSNPLPTVTLVSPACAAVGNSLPITVTGTNFLNGPTDPTQPKVIQASTLNWIFGSSQSQFTIPVATITSTQITLTIPATAMASPGTASVTVSNPPSLPVPSVPGSVGSGGGTSSPAWTIAIQSTACPAAAKVNEQTALSSATVAEETPAVSLDGRYVAYSALQDGRSQIFLRDTCEGAPSTCAPSTSLVSVSSEGDSAAGDSHSPSMSSDGRYVAFSSVAPNLVDNSPPGRQIYLRDTCAGAGESCRPSTLLISADSNGALVGTESILPSVSSSGRFVAFLAVTPSLAPELSSAESNHASAAINTGYRQVFVRDTCLGVTNCTPKTTRISLQPGDGSDGNTKPAGPAISGNARRVGIAGGNVATLFTRSVAVDDRVFLAITNENK